MKRYLLILFIGLFSMVSFAHNPDVSTTMLVEKENNVWVLSISASLTAFQQEIRTHFSETPYKTPEEFQQMVLQHIKKNLDIKFNNEQEITLGEGHVKLGHETNVVFEVFGVPSQIKSVSFQNSAFKDISRNQSALLLLKNGFKKEHFVLNNQNQHILNLKVDGNKFVEVVESEQSTLSLKKALVFIGVLLFVLLAVFLMKTNNERRVYPELLSK